MTRNMINNLYLFAEILILELVTRTRMNSVRNALIFVNERIRPTSHATSIRTMGERADVIIRISNEQFIFLLLSLRRLAIYIYNDRSR